MFGLLICCKLERGMLKHVLHRPLYMYHALHALYASDPWLSWLSRCLSCAISSAPMARPSLSCRVPFLLQALVSNGGYRYLDVRPKIEYDDVGKVIGSLNIPVKNGTKRWSSEKQRKVWMLLLSLSHGRAGSSAMRGSHT